MSPSPQTVRRRAMLFITPSSPFVSSTDRYILHTCRIYHPPCCTIQPPSTPQTPPPPPSPRPPNFFLDTHLQRPSLNSLPDNMQEILLHPNASNFRFLPLWHETPLLKTSTNNSNPRLVLWTSTELRAQLAIIRSKVPDFFPFIAAISEAIPPLAVQYFTVDVSASPTPPTNAMQSARPLNAALRYIREEEAYLLAHAKSLLSWHASARFCSRCGVATRVTQGGTARACQNDACSSRNIYPRIMPSILAVVVRNDTNQILLGHKTSWKPGRYSLLAGFVELFESLEQAVVREVYEESGVVLDERSVRYHSCQPWASAPHASLMCAFTACVKGARDAVITVDGKELEDARWFGRVELRQQLDLGEMSIPSRASLSRRLILEWLGEPDRE